MNVFLEKPLIVGLIFDKKSYKHFWKFLIYSIELAILGLIKNDAFVLKKKTKFL